jgi:hypothetical protein
MRVTRCDGCGNDIEKPKKTFVVCVYDDHRGGISARPELELCVDCKNKMLKAVGK